MGFFSWTCAKTNLPVLASTSWGERPDLCEATLLRKSRNGQTIVVQGTYDGYGRLDDMDFTEGPIYSELETGKAKLVLTKFYVPGVDTFESLGRSHNDPGQGHFHEEDMLDKAMAKGGFPSYRGFAMAYDKALDLDLALSLRDKDIQDVLHLIKTVRAAIAQQRRGSIEGAPEDFDTTRFVQIMYRIDPDVGPVLKFGENGPAVPVQDNSANVLAATAIAASGEPRSTAFPLPDGGDILCLTTKLGEGWYMSSEQSGHRSIHLWPRDAICASGYANDGAQALVNALLRATHETSDEPDGETPDFAP